MATRGWGTDRPVADLLFEEGWRFDFYQAVRILEVLRSDATPVGAGADPSREPVRFHSAVGFDFPPSPVAEVTADPPDEDVPRMVVTFLGLAGAHGPLPPAYTELIVERLKQRDTTLRDFLDIFNHRLVSLLYRVRKHRRIGFDTRPPDQTPFADQLRALMGMGTRGLAGRMAVPDRSLLLYTGLLAQQPRSLAGLENLLRNFFGVPVRGRSLQGRWVDLSEDQITRIGASGRNRGLGREVVLGTRVWDQEVGIGLVIGPMNFERFLDFLPNGQAFPILKEIIRFYGNDAVEADITLQLKKEEVPNTILDSLNGSRLGWTSWFVREKFPGSAARIRLG